MSLSGRPSEVIKTELEKAREELDKEFVEWQKLGIDPANVHQNPFLLERRTAAIAKMLVKKGICTDEELELLLCEVSLEALKEIRAANQDQIIAQRQAAIVVPESVLKTVPGIDEILRKKL